MVGEQVERLAWDCPAGAEVELVVIHDAGHAWPVVPMDGAATIWDFFSRQALPADPAT